MGKIISAIVGGALGVGATFGFVSAVTSPDTKPPVRVVEVQVAGITCPEEDTCSADLDYRGGTWYAKVWK